MFLRSLTPCARASYGLPEGVLESPSRDLPPLLRVGQRGGGASREAEAPEGHTHLVHEHLLSPLGAQVGPSRSPHVPLPLQCRQVGLVHQLGDGPSAGLEDLESGLEIVQDCEESLGGRVRIRVLNEDLLRAELAEVPDRVGADDYAQFSMQPLLNGPRSEALLDGQLKNPGPETERLYLTPSTHDIFYTAALLPLQSVVLPGGAP